MAKCTTCGKFVAAKGSAATCCRCGNKFHLACAGISDTAKISNDWSCQVCKDKTGKGCIRPTPMKGVSIYGSEDSPTSIDEEYESAGDTEKHGSKDRNNLAKEMSLLREDLRTMREELKSELREIRLEVADLRQSVASHKKKVENLETRLIKLEEQQNAASPNTMDDTMVQKLEDTVEHLKSELNDRKQDLLLSDIEIANLPEDAGENVVHTVELIAKKLGVELDSRDIVFAERVGPKAVAAGSAELRRTDSAAVGSRGRRIVVRLARRAVRDDLLRAARVRRGATSADLGFAAPPRRFYVNERLTKTNRILFYRARQAAAKLEWKYTWTKRGRVLARQGDGKPTHTIRTDHDLERVFGREALEEKKC